jgi:plastocyanin
MHTLLDIALVPVLAAEKSKTPFYIAGGVLVVWALVVSLAFGLRNADFPGSLGGQRIVSAITAVLVIAAAATAVTTAGGESKTEAATGAEATGETTSAPAEQPPPPAPTPTSTAAAPAPTKTAPAKTAPAKKPAAPAVTKLALAANTAGQLEFNTKQLSAKAGSVTITFTNASPVEHDVKIAQGSTELGGTPVFTGGSKAVTVQLKPGTYTFFCSVPGHRQAGMEGTLTVS